MFQILCGVALLASEDIWSLSKIPVVSPSPHQQYHHRSTTSVIPASTTYKTDFLTSLIEIRLPQPQPQPQPQLQPKPLNESCSGVCSGCNQARRDSTWFTDRVRAHTSVAKNHCQYQVNWQLSIVNTTSIDNCKVPTDTKDFQADAPGLQCWQCDGSVSTLHPFFPRSHHFSLQFVKHERRTCLRIGERKQNCDGSVQYCELRLRVGYRWGEHLVDQCTVLSFISSIW